MFTGISIISVLYMAVNICYVRVPTVSSPPVNLAPLTEDA